MHGWILQFENDTMGLLNSMIKTIHRGLGACIWFVKLKTCAALNCLLLKNMGCVSMVRARGATSHVKGSLLKKRHTGVIKEDRLGLASQSLLPISGVISVTMVVLTTHWPVKEASPSFPGSVHAAPRKSPVFVWGRFLLGWMGEGLV